MAGTRHPGKSTPLSRGGRAPNGCEAYRVGGVADHVHLAVRLSRTLSVADLVKEVKTASSKWLKAQDPAFKDFHWQLGYGAFSVGMSQKETLLHYIRTQEEHHRTQPFQEEYRDLLTKYGIEYDETLCVGLTRMMRRSFRTHG